MAVKKYCNVCGEEQTAKGQTVTPYEIHRGSSPRFERRFLCDDCKDRIEREPHTTLIQVLSI